MYPELMVIPMREELTRAGINETRTAEDVDAALAQPGTTLLVAPEIMGEGFGGPLVRGFLLIELGCLSRVQRDQYVMSRRGHGRLRQRWNVHLRLDCIDGERITANGIHCVVLRDLNNCTLN